MVLLVCHRAPLVVCAIQVALCRCALMPTAWPSNVVLMPMTAELLQLKSGWYVPAGVGAPASACPGPKSSAGCGGIHWFRADNDSMTHLNHTGFLYTSRTITEMECPDVPTPTNECLDVSIAVCLNFHRLLQLSITRTICWSRCLSLEGR